MHWHLLRIWHLETMECVVDSPHAATFTRTSYVSTPALWITLHASELARRVELLLQAHYRVRAATLATPWSDERMVLFAYDFEWVANAPNPARPGAHAEPWLLPVAHANLHLAETAFRVLDDALRTERPGIAARCYDDAFEMFRIDRDDTWHIIDGRDRGALFASRYN